VSRPLLRALALAAACAVAVLATLPVARAADTPAAPTAAAAPATTTRDFPPGLVIPEGARVDAAFDAERATEAWLAKLSPEQRAQSDAYFENGYWLDFAGLLWGLAIATILLRTRWSVWMRDRAERISRRPWLSVAIYAVLYVAVTFVLWLPYNIYVNFVREHAYGLSNLSFPGWLGETFTGLAVSLVGMPLVLTLAYAAVRKLGARWWSSCSSWGSAWSIRWSSRRCSTATSRWPKGPHATRSSRWHARATFPPSTSSGSTPRGRPRASVPTSAVRWVSRAST
jgi:STE24 endopeptidase